MARRRLRALLTVSILSLLLAPASWAQVIDGPKEGLPGQALTFRLLSGGTQLPVDRWEQVFNPDRYTGNGSYFWATALFSEDLRRVSNVATAPFTVQWLLRARLNKERHRLPELVGSGCRERREGEVMARAGTTTGGGA